MSELVTSAAATSQFNLFAPRPQVFVVERTGNAPDDATPDVSQGGLHNLVSNASVNRHDDAPTASLAVHDGPSRARIEIRSLDLGLTPAEVVGTQDVLQRFDSNGDGRVDLLESDKATLVRQNLFTFAGVGNAAAEPDVPAAPAPVIVNSDAAPAAATAPAEGASPGEPKKFFVPLTPDGRPAAQKFADAAQAASGGTTATVAVSRKFYGQGAEVVVGPVAAHGTAAAISLHDKAAAQKQRQVSTEDGTGEKRLYDKVAQTTPQHHQFGQSGASLHEKARQIAEAINGSKKTVMVQVATYSNAAAASIKQAAIVVESTDVTA